MSSCSCLGYLYMVFLDIFFTHFSNGLQTQFPCVSLTSTLYIDIPAQVYALLQSP